jgi:hypothetical protein
MQRTANPHRTYRVRVSGKLYNNLPTPRDGGVTVTIPCQHCGCTNMYYRSYKYQRSVGWELVCSSCGENHMVYSI